MPDYSIQRLRGKWAIVWTDAETGRRRRHALTATDYLGAQAEARSRWLGGDRSPWTMARLMLAYIADRQNDGIATTGRQLDAWKAMKPYWENVTPDMIDDQLAKDYAATRRVSPATIRYELGQLAAALNWGKREKHIAEAPPIWRPSAPERIERHLTKAQFGQFLDAGRRPHVKLYAILGVTTAARPSAILELTWDRVDFDAKMANLNPVGRIQTAKRRPRVPLNDRAIGALEEAYRARQSNYVIEHGGERILCIKKGFQAASARCGFKVTPYMLRHSAAVWMAEDGVSMSEIAQLMGHEDSRTTERHYARFTPGFLRRAAGALTW